MHDGHDPDELLERAPYLALPPPGWSLRWYRDLLGSSDWRDAAWTSLQAAILTMVVATGCGTAAAYGVQEGAAGWRRPIIVVFGLPMIIPAVLIAVGDFILFAQLNLNNTLAGLVLAHSALALPIVFIIVSGGLAGFHRAQERAARSMGAGRLLVVLAARAIRRWLAATE